MRTCFIATVFNEEKTIIPFLESIQKQIQLPDEVIIVDGGSTDNTVIRIQNFIARYGKRYVLLEKKGNRSVGRNEAIRHAKGDIILCSDAGCILDAHWAEEIIKPFSEKSVSVVAGYYKGKPTSLLQRCVIPYALVMPDKVNPNTFLPATRSMAFKKTVWEKLEGFPEEYAHNEDYVFAKQIQAHGFHIAFTSKAFVYWTPPTTIKKAAMMMGRFAFGDAEAGIFRPKVVFIFVRYLLLLSLLQLYLVFHISLCGISFGLLLLAYLSWSIQKNYQYVGDIRAIYMLLILQILSDLVVMSGTVLGLGKRLFFFTNISQHKGLVGSILLYCFLVLSVITWGIPHLSHPFNYHMDEWAQSQSIRALFRHGTPNISGASHGAIFQYLLSGMYLIPFILAGFVNPFVIKNSLEHIDMQMKLFEILRINTLLFGIGSLILIYHLSKKYLKSNPLITTLLFLLTPIFIILSEYFKYDIALIFWILVSIWRLFAWQQAKTKKNWFILCIVSGFALATKLSAIPLIPLIVCTYFLHTKRKDKNRIIEFIQGIGIFAGIFLLFGIPDIFISWKEYLFWLTPNIHPTTTSVANYQFGMSFWWYYILHIYPALFGQGFYLVYVVCIVMSLISGRKNVYIQTLLLGLILFTISLIPLQIGAQGNKLLVLLPFAALLSGYVLTKISQTKRVLVYAIFSLVCMYQVCCVLGWQSVKWYPDLRDTSSLWISKHIAVGSTIGIENVPIFQSVPNIALQQFYTHQYFPQTKTSYRWIAIDSHTYPLPPTVIITNGPIEKKYLSSSPKKDLLTLLQKEGYTEIVSFSPDMRILHLFASTEDYWLNGIIPSATTIDIYQQPKEVVQ